MPEPYTLTIKSVNQSLPDQKIECDLESSVYNLKEIIKNQHPGTPSVQDQKLIYFGQLLQDDSTLRAALRHPPEDNTHTLHLVCPHNFNCDIPKMQVQSEGVRQRNTSSAPVSDTRQQIFSQYYYTQMPPGADPIQQMASMQQLYAQYYASYLQYVMSQNNQAQPSLIQPQTSTSNNSEPQAVVEQPVQQPQERQPANPPRPQRDGIFGEEAEEGPRDWLDLTYMVARFCLLLSIIYFYSNIYRFGIVACGWIIMFTWSLYRRAIANSRNQNTPNQEDANNQNNNEDVNEGNGETEEPVTNQDEDVPEARENSENANETTTNEQASTTPVANQSLLALSMTFIFGLFSSLLPDPQDLV